MAFDEHGDVVPAYDPRNDQEQAEIEALKQELGLDLKIKALAKDLSDRQIQKLFRRFLVEVNSEYELVCFKMALGMPMGKDVTLRSVAKRFGVRFQAVKNMKDKFAREFGFPPSIYDKNLDSRKSYSLRNHRNQKRKAS